jgi:TolB-like protein
MASLIPDYEYDIFISYRQKDNKYDGWVTDFVENLKKELEATFKEDVSVYFDINPHDGLLETNDVDASLSDKLKCIVFIPIISRTYCDSKSFAWEHEFKTFVDLASKDKLGLKIKLPNGNVTNRVLPIRIYDLESDDLKQCESILGGVLRGVEFIYKSSGVNRPLRSKEENPQDNLNHTLYRNQLNKVANAIKEVITGIIQNELKHEQIPKEINMPASDPQKNNKAKIILGSFFVMAMIILGYLLTPEIFNPKNQIEKSIAVLPFRNDSASDSTTYFINGLMEKILNNLQLIKELRVISRTSVEQYRNTSKSIPEIAKEQGVNFIVEGSGQKYGNTFSVSVQLIKAAKENHLWGNSYEREIKEIRDITGVQSEIAQSIAEELKVVITPEEKQLISRIPTTNLTALDFFERGRDEHIKYWLDNSKTISLQKAISFYKLALKNDSSFAQAYTGLALARINSYWENVYTKMIFSEKELKIVNDSIISLADKALALNNKLDEAYLVKGICAPDENTSIKEFRKALVINPNSSLAYNCLANIHYSKSESIEYLTNILKAIQLERGPMLPGLLKGLGTWYECYGFSGNAIEVYDQKFQLTNDTLQYYQDIAGPYWAEENWKESIKWTKKIVKRDPNNTWANSQLAGIYSFMGKYDSVTYYVDKVIKASPNSRNMEFLKGWSLWISGEKREANAVFDKVIGFTSGLVKSGQNNFYDCIISASIFSMQGDQEKALKYLNMLSKPVKEGWFIISMENDPQFKEIRLNKQFQEILSVSKSNRQKEHDKIRAWLKENNLLKI